MNNEFHFEINNFEDFVRFVEIIRNKNLDINELKRLARGLDKSTDELLKAEEHDKGV